MAIAELLLARCIRLASEVRPMDYSGFPLHHDGALFLYNGPSTRIHRAEMEEVASTSPTDASAMKQTMRTSSRIAARPKPPKSDLAPAPIVKPAPRIQNSCRHKCFDKAKCKHKCCAETLRIVDIPKGEEFINCADLLVYLLGLLPAKDLLSFRQVSNHMQYTIDNSKTFRQQLFLEAEDCKSPLFRSSITSEEYLVRPPGQSYSDIRLLHGVDASSMPHIPPRTVRINPLLFNIYPKYSPSSLEEGSPYRLYGLPSVAIRYSNPARYSKNGVNLLTDLRFKITPTHNKKLHADSSCMNMFITQPPIKDLMVNAEQEVTKGPKRWRNLSYVPETTLIASDGEGLRFRDLQPFMNRMLGEDDVTQVVTDLGRSYLRIPRCEALDEDGEPVFLAPNQYRINLPRYG
ncbi:unnamed protein product [Zymoseptoria tritici ST99CH_1A5]|uniref:F-box domain-containing protein n=1 Tax=Zymoseptoria tritici ST99CH_1A5 TaxID=1276529 RepID=A0A1Y6LUQ4_ZYMTR|nr:unnamed protein product [Zymoseptoria tritici ST99CH_1A5]